MKLAPLALAAMLMAAAPALAELPVGAKAPSFTTQGAMAGKPFKVDLKRLLARGPVVLYFFPAAFTPGCNAEAKAFAESIDAFKAEGATVIGLSADPVDRLAAFSSEHCAGKFAVATATPGIIAGYDAALGQAVPGPDGKKRQVTNRTSYVVAPDGKVLYAYTDMKPAAHIRNTLAALREWRATKR